MIKLIVGLGNPGAEYEATRHNAGFWWLDSLAQGAGVGLQLDSKYEALQAKTQLQGQAVWLQQPQTYMNLSGRSVGGLANFYKIVPEEILVVHDELDLAPGQAKVKQGGSHAGHNGLKDIAAKLGSLNFWRLRLGVGHPGVKTEVVSWVLKKPPANQRSAIDACIAGSLLALPDLMQGRMAEAQRHIHSLR